MWPKIRGRAGTGARRWPTLPPAPECRCRWRPSSCAGVPGASPASRQRVMQAAEELGYRPDARARLLRSGRSRLIGVTFGVQHAFHGDLVSGLYDAADAAGFELALSAATPRRDEQQAVGTLLQDRCEALILLGPQASTGYLADLAGRLPLVVVGQSRQRPGESTSSAPPTTKGCTWPSTTLWHWVIGRIAHIDGGRAPGAAERRRGYREAMYRHGLDAEIRVIARGSHRGGRCGCGSHAAGRGPPAHRRRRVQRPQCHRRPRCRPKGGIDRAGRHQRRRLRRQPVGPVVPRRSDHRCAGRRPDGHAGRGARGRAGERSRSRSTGVDHPAAAGHPEHNGPAPKLMLDAVDRAAPSGYTVAKLVVRDKRYSGRTSVCSAAGRYRPNQSRACRAASVSVPGSWNR